MGMSLSLGFLWLWLLVMIAHTSKHPISNGQGQITFHQGKLMQEGHYFE